MSDLIVWCNTNQNFINFILSVSTVLLSTVAIGVSLHTARLPFKKKIQIKVSSYIQTKPISPVVLKTMTLEDLETVPKMHMISISVANIGNRVIYPRQISFYVENKHLFSPGVGKDVRLLPGEVTTSKCEVFLLHNLKNSPQNSNVYVHMEDTEGDIHKKKYCKVKDITKLIDFEKIDELKKEYHDTIMENSIKALQRTP